LPARGGLRRVERGPRDPLQRLGERLDRLDRQVDVVRETMESTCDRVAALQDQISAFRGETSGGFHDVLLNLPRRLPPDEIRAHTATLLADTNSPISFVGYPAFRQFARLVIPDAELPTPPEVRQEILNQADQFRASFTPDTAGGPYISLMVDGSSMAGRKWLGVCIAAAKAFYFWRVLRVVDNRGRTIARALADVVEELSRKRFLVCAAVTDNAANEISAVRELAGVTGRPIVRIPCVSHTVNLAVHDFFAAAFGNGAFEADMQALYNALPTRAQGSPFYGLSSVCPTRWLSYGVLVARIVARSDIAFVLLAGSGPAYQVLLRYHFPELDGCFRVVNGFMSWTEGQSSFLGEVLPAALQALDRLLGLHCEGNRYAIHFLRAVRDRLDRTADMGQLLLGYLVTERGLAWYRGLPFDGPPEGFSQDSVRGTVEPFLRYFVDLLDVDSGRFLRAFGLYLSDAPWPTRQPAVQFWDTVSGYSATQFSEERGSYRWIAVMAFILMRMPCSEAEVERVFSRMRRIIGKRSVRIKRDLLEARLILQMNGPKMGPGLRAALRNFEGQDDARPPGGQATPAVAMAPAHPGFPVPVIFRPARVAPAGGIAPPGEFGAALVPRIGDGYGEPVIPAPPE
jgi:hypothetical protein